MTSNTATSENPCGLLSSGWRPAGLGFLAACLAGLAVGLWPDAVYPSKQIVRPASLPALQTLALAQISFMLLAYPLVLLRRDEFGGQRPRWANSAVEVATWL
ncbi:MAG: hypothetical protein KAU28_08065, partial [Phycisphaerae bacterium]|nr:hypothetical protein [Phycisphaerae bacterium]